MQSNDDPRRLFLLQALAAGLYAIGGSSRVSAEILGQVPTKLRQGKSFYRVKGDVRVNGQTATKDTLLTAKDKIETGAGSEAVFVVGQDAFMMRENSDLQLAQSTPQLTGKARFEQRLKKNKARIAQSGEQQRTIPSSQVVDSFRLITGGVLSVFGKTSHKVKTSTASIGIRGTGVYFESQPDISYVCTCYGVTDIVALTDPTSTVQVISQHHDAPKYILAGGTQGQRVRAAPFKNHDDLELMLLEELVGRTAPFSVSGQHYSAPRRDY